MNLSKITELLNSKHAVDKLIRQEKNRLVREVETMEDNLFWKLVASLVREITSAKERGQEVKSGIHNFFYHNQDLGAKKLLSFVKTYSEKVNHISSDKHYLHLADKDGYYCSDDSWYDLTDSFPLHGREIYEAFSDLAISPNHSVFKEIKENHICSFLAEKLIPWLGRDNDLEETEEPTTKSPTELLEKELKEANETIQRLKGIIHSVEIAMAGV